MKKTSMDELVQRIAAKHGNKQPGASPLSTMWEAGWGESTWGNSVYGSEQPVTSRVLLATLEEYLRVHQNEDVEGNIEQAQHDKRLQDILKTKLAMLGKADITLLAAEFGITLRAPRRSKTESLLEWRILKIPADRLVRASFAALLPGAIVPRDDHEPMIAAYEYTTPKTKDQQPRARFHIGCLAGRGNKLAQVIEAQGALCTKVQIALWAHWWRSGSEREKITYTIDDLLDDVGYKKKHRAHKTENRLAVGRALAALFDLETDVEFEFKGRTVNVTGPLWERGSALDLRDNGKRVRGIIRYAPGEWYTKALPEWRKRNDNFAHFAPGILRLSNQERDRAAVFLGSYLVMLARMNGNAHKTLTGDTLAKMAGLKERKPGRLAASIERALDQLVEVGVIKTWAYRSDGDPVENPDDLDNPDTLAGLADDGLPDNFRNRRILITWPDMVANTAPGIEAQHQHHIKAAEKQKARRRTAAAKPRRETA